MELRRSRQRRAPWLHRSRGRSSARSERDDDHATRPVSPEKGRLEKAVRVAQATSVMGQLQIEATGETVGEAKWSALRELEKRQPGLDKAAVRFQVVSEGERGLLGVGYAPARVIATVSAVAQAVESHPDESDLVAEVRDLVERIVDGIGVVGRIEIEEDEETVTVSCAGPDLGMLIGRHGQTIDAVQNLANAVMFRRHPE